MKKSKDYSKSNYREEITIPGITKDIWKNKMIVLRSLLVFFILGVLISFAIKKEYRAHCTFMVEDNNGGSRFSGLMSQFGGLAGFRFPSMETEGMISPELYQKIVHSTPFLLSIISDTIHVKKFDKDLVVHDYLLKWEKPPVFASIMKYTIGLPFLILNSIRSGKTETPHENSLNNNSPIIYLREDFDLLLNNMRERISVMLEKETGIVTISARMPDPNAAAEIVSIIYDDLVHYLIDYKIEKARLDFDFIDERTNEAKIRYTLTQDRLATFRDKNKNIISASYNIEEEKLMSEFQLAFDLYNSLSQQLEQSRIKVQEAMPVFKIVNPIILPLKKSKPKRSMIILSMLFLGGAIGVGIILFPKI